MQQASKEEFDKFLKFQTESINVVNNYSNDNYVSEDIDIARTNETIASTKFWDSGKVEHFIKKC